MKEQPLHLKDRIISVDALRGFAMFLILATQIGGAPIFQTFTMLWGEKFQNAASAQLSWENQNVSLMNIAQSIFVFVVGLSFHLPRKRVFHQKNRKRCTCRNTPFFMITTLCRHD
jgi:uncharacterized membrane protein